MSDFERLKSIFNTEEKCLRFLLVNNEIETCNSCNGTEFYYGDDFEKTFKKVCKTCKKKISPTKDTIFQNVKFGLVTAFCIYIEYKLCNKELSSVEVANTYHITQKTAWEFLNKIKNANKDFSIQRYLNDEILENEIKLFMWLIRSKNY